MGLLDNLLKVAATGKGLAASLPNGRAYGAGCRGIQDVGAQACAEHYIGNEQERNRDTMNDDIDDRKLQFSVFHRNLTVSGTDSTVKNPFWEELYIQPLGQVYHKLASTTWRNVSSHLGIY